MFLSEDLKRVSVEAMEKAIADAVAGLIGGKLICKVNKIDYESSRYSGAVLDLHLRRPIALLGEGEASETEPFDPALGEPGGEREGGAKA